MSAVEIKPFAAGTSVSRAGLAAAALRAHGFNAWTQLSQPWQRVIYVHTDAPSEIVRAEIDRAEAV